MNAITHAKAKLKRACHIVQRSALARALARVWEPIHSADRRAAGAARTLLNRRMEGEE
jgi:hypothetical protein